MDRELTVLEHIKELRKLLIIGIIFILIGAILSFLCFDYITELLLRPIISVTSDSDQNLYINTLHEGFVTKLQISLISSLVITIPIHIFNLLLFIIPALQKREKRILFTTLVVSAIFILISSLYGYNFLIPTSIEFLTGSNFSPQGVGMLLSYKTNLMFILQLLLATLLIFQVPIVLELLLILRILKLKQLLSLTKYIVVLIFIISAIITPPDFVSQLCVALPLTLLYLLTLLVAKTFNFGGDKI